MTMRALFERSVGHGGARVAFSGTVSFDEPMSRHTTFRIGGPAALYLKPDAACFTSYVPALLRLARAEAVPVFVLGGGANLLVADSGIRGIVLDTGSWSGAFAEWEASELLSESLSLKEASEGGSLPLRPHSVAVYPLCGDTPQRPISPAARNLNLSLNLNLNPEAGRINPGNTSGGRAGTDETSPAAPGGAAAVNVRFRAGTLTDDAVRWAAANGLSGLEDFAGLPGTIGGAVWMNARCYESSVSDILIRTTILDERLEQVTVPKDPAAFAYKKSPFQGREALIIEAVISLSPGESALVTKKTADRRAEREAKGHFRYPSAGSVFKNNRDFGRPAGKIIEELGLRGFRIGGAQIAPWHGNFIINTGGATADDVKRLIALIEEKALRTFGFNLEREIIYTGG